MSQMANILVKDDAATPVEFTLIPITDTPAPFWRAAVNNVPLDGQVRCTETMEKMKNGSYRLSVKLEVPVMETLGASGTSSGYVAPPKVAYVTTCIFTMFADKRSTSQDRANALRMAVGILQGAKEVTASGTLANTAAGGAFLANTAPGVQLFTNAILPN